MEYPEEPRDLVLEAGLVPGGVRVQVDDLEVREGRHPLCQRHEELVLLQVDVWVVVVVGRRRLVFVGRRSRGGRFQTKEAQGILGGRVSLEKRLTMRPFLGAKR